MPLSFILKTETLQLCNKAVKDHHGEQDQDREQDTGVHGQQQVKAEPGED